jgi:hypothetical protein
MNSLDVVPVRVAQEHAVVAGVVFRPQPGPVQQLRAGTFGGALHRVNRLPRRRAQRDVHRPHPAVHQGPKPELGPTVQAAQPTTVPSSRDNRISSRTPSGANTSM